jgi:4-alpha-glucanotransferase
MRFPRSSGILLHPTSLPGPFGIGDLGPEALRFADFLSDSGQTLWQVLPLGPTGYGDSPYQSFSAMAGNPVLISPEWLEKRGWLEAAQLRDVPSFPPDRVDFERVSPWKKALLESAARRFFKNAVPAEGERFDSFCRMNAGWLDDFALFMALKQQNGGASWSRWEPGVRWRKPEALAGAREQMAEPIATLKFQQFAFFSQWRELRDYCRERKIRLMGDLPIYVSHDSADVWVNPRYYHLDPNGDPTVVAGVPPDYFSATGQLWGNPIYRWDVLAHDGYQWWLQRFRAVLDMVDMIRLDHFRGFEAYWEVPATEPTAVNGRWVKGPGSELFEAARRALGELPLVAENLGVITPAVEAIREEFGFPGMTILQFAFGKDSQAATFRPHNYPREVVAYTGTHDCDTTVGWWSSEGKGESTRSADEVRSEHENALKYLNSDGSEINWAFIRALEASVADTVLIPMQDVLGLGSEARMNQPATLGGNWSWRVRAGMLTHGITQRLAEFACLYERGA